MKKRVLSWGLILVLLLGVFPLGAFAAQTFQDVKAGMYYYDPVLWAVDNEITNGVSATLFAPENVCTRDQIVTFLWRAQGRPEPRSSANPFSDVKNGAYYFKAVLWAVEQNITNGMSEHLFGPAEPCTRAQVATFLWRAAGKPKASASNPFSDVKSGTYYYDAVMWAVAQEITNGTSATTFSPDATCTRGQIVTFLYRARNQMGGAQIKVAFSSSLPMQKALNPVSLRSGETLPLPEHPVPAAKEDRAKYVFCGWCVDPECTMGFDPGAQLTEDLTLYADWYEKPVAAAETFRTETLAGLREFDAQTAIGESVNEIAAQYQDEEGYLLPEHWLTASKEAYAWATALAEVGAIKRAALHEEAYVVTMYMNDDSVMLYRPNLRNCNSGGDDALTVFSFNMFNQADENERQHHFKTTPEDVGNLLRDGSEITEHRIASEQPSLQQVTNLLQSVDENTRVILWDGHGNPSGKVGDDTYYLTLGEHVTEETYKQYQKDYEGMLSRDTHNILGVKDSYISATLGYAEDAIFICGSCFSYNKKFIEILQKHGFDTQMLCEGKTDGIYAREMMQTIAEGMLEKDEYGRYVDVETAYDDAIEKHGFKEGHDYALLPDSLDPGNRKIYYIRSKLLPPARLVQPEDYVVAKFALKDAQGKAIVTDKAEVTLTGTDGTVVQAKLGLQTAQLVMWARLKPDTYQLEVKLEGYPTYHDTLVVDKLDDIINVSCQLGDYHALYAKIVEERECTEGLGMVQEYRWENTRQMTGVSMVRLLDMDDDGIDELILAYMPDALNNAQAPKCEIWTYNGKEAVRVWNGGVVALGQDISYSVTLAKVDGVWMYLDGAMNGPYAPYYVLDLYALKNGKFVKAHSATMTASSNPTFQIDGKTVDRKTYGATGDSWLSNTLEHQFLVQVSEGAQELKTTKAERAKLGLTTDADALALVQERVRSAGAFLDGHFYGGALKDQSDVLEEGSPLRRYYRVKNADSMKAFRAYAGQFFAPEAVDEIMNDPDYHWLERGGKLYLSVPGLGDADLYHALAAAYRDSDTQYTVNFIFCGEEYGGAYRYSNRLLYQNGNWVWERLDWFFCFCSEVKAHL